MELYKIYLLIGIMSGIAIRSLRYTKINPYYVAKMGVAPFTTKTRVIEKTRFIDESTSITHIHTQFRMYGIWWDMCGKVDMGLFHAQDKVVNFYDAAWWHLSFPELLPSYPNDEQITSFARQMAKVRLMLFEGYNEIPVLIM